MRDWRGGSAIKNTSFSSPSFISQGEFPSSSQSPLTVSGGICCPLLAFYALHASGAQTEKQPHKHTHKAK